MAVKFLELQVLLNGANRGLETDTIVFFEGKANFKVVEDMHANLVLVLERITSSVQLNRETFIL